ncbi:DUF4268 domain-containing protein [Sulfitobacter sp. HNIBRBA2951]|uniref:DUF4268 domain-containing protein n=1 Tax=Sulfitobacter aquimarinus TaxID=3158557 RepID=UPI0032DE7DF0
MYSINRSTNQITPLQKHSFKDLGFTERKHLQEWLAQHPEALGDLLIIQKEFDGFDNTRERLDLLALDRQGRIVVIENKLDDSGRDVIWQALKYAAYCSTLKTAQIVEIYSRYLGQPIDTAREAITEFIDAGDSEELSLNTANSQRIIFVAASFRPEITATALWLLGKGVSITCFQVSPFSSGDELFLTVDQIIPPPETSDYMIQLAEKSAVEETASIGKAERHIRRRTYWEAVMEYLALHNTPLLDNRTATQENWMNIASGKSGLHFTLILLKTEVRVEFIIDTPDKARNLRIFQHLKDNRAVFEDRFGAPLEWRDLPDARLCRIVSKLELDTTEIGNQAKAIEWHHSRIQSLITAFSPSIPEIAAL